MNKQTISLRLSPVLLEELERESAAMRISKTEYITQSIREKINRVADGTDRLAGLSKSDCDLVWSLIACLKKSDPGSSGFRKAVKANFDWLRETIE